jgi:hypothetical protein
MRVEIYCFSFFYQETIFLNSCVDATVQLQVQDMQRVAAERKRPRNENSRNLQATG